MPVIVALAIRALIQMAITLGLVNLAERFVLPLINTAIAKVISLFGVDEETAKDFMANEIIVFAESVGIGALTLRAKIPTKIAEKLGFTSKGFLRRTISSQQKSKLPTTTSSQTISTLSPQQLATELTAIGQSQGLGYASSMGSFFNTSMKILGVGGVAYLGLINTIDFANWNGAYEKTFQKIFSYVGLKPDAIVPKANTISADMWKKIYSVIEELGPRGISLPGENFDVPYSRENLIKLVDHTVAYMVANGQTANFKNVIGIMLPLIQITPGASVKDDFGGGPNASFALTPGQFGGSTTPAITKVFTGIVSQGVVGEGLVFEARPDDLIESIEELKTAAGNNLSSYLATLPGKIVYEVKVVSSITTKEGFKQTGTAQRIQTGTYQNGQPKYKTVVNKFATVVLYAMTDKGTRSKLTTIVLGPVDSAKLLVGQNDLRTLETELPSLITTTDINEIQNISQPTQTQQPAAPYVPPVQAVEPAFFQYRKVAGETFNNVIQKFKISMDQFLAVNGGINRDPGNWPGLERIAFDVNIPKGASASGTAPAVSSPAATSGKPGAGAATLFEWYQAQGQALPSVQARSVIYQNLGLGQASFYTGTAEQNTKLLNALKSS